MRRYNLLSIAALSIFTFTVPAFAGRILVNNDEWAFTDFGYQQAGHDNADLLARNVAEFLTGGTGEILIYSSNHGVTQPEFISSLRGAGYNVTDGDEARGKSFELATLMNYDAIFMGGEALSKNDDVLADYVNRGGGVFLVLGTGVGGPLTEALLWNGFLNRFGLNAETSYNLYSGTFGASPQHSVFSAVGNIYYNNGNSITLLDPPNPYARIIQRSGQDYGLFGVYDGAHVPEPQTLTLFAAGLGLLVWMRRIRRAL
jgi:hypothetical protein